MLLLCPKSSAKIEMLKIIRRVLAYVPGVEIFGPYRFLPFFFVVGGGLEYALIHWYPGGHNFYETFKKKHAQRTAIKQLKILGELGGINEEELES